MPGWMRRVQCFFSACGHVLEKEPWEKEPIPRRETFLGTDKYGYDWFHQHHQCRRCGQWVDTGDRAYEGQALIRAWGWDVGLGH